MTAWSAFRDGALGRRLVEAIRRRASRRWTILEVCGGQTHGLLRSGIDRLLEREVEFAHGPGCPVCVTPRRTIDEAIALAERPSGTLVSFGDMLRVPGSRGDLLAARARGADIRVVYSPLDALGIARSQPARETSLFAIGFETTAPAIAATILEAERCRLDGLYALVAHVRVAPAIEALLAAPGCRVDGILAAGHVCTIAGLSEHRAIAARYGVPIVVTGFEPVDLLRGTLELVEDLEAGRSGLRNAYERVVSPDGNPTARALVDEVFRVEDVEWRGMGMIPRSGLRLRPRFAHRDARRLLAGRGGETEEHESQKAADEDCRAGEVLRGALRPDHCPQFGERCTPRSPLGAPMVSGEGACAAYWRYRGSRSPFRSSVTR